MGDYKCSRGLSWFGTRVQGQADRSGSRALCVQNKHGRLSQGIIIQSSEDHPDAFQHLVYMLTHNIVHCNLLKVMGISPLNTYTMHALAS